MAHVPMEGKGVFFPEGQKKKHPKAPDWRGQIMHDGRIIKLSGWIKKSQYGEFLSLSVDNYAGANEPKKFYPREVQPEDDNSVPF